MTFANLLAFGFAGLAIPIVALYILKVRRRPVDVPYLRLWETLLHETRAHSLFQRLKRLLSLLLQLAILTFLVLALARPSLDPSIVKPRQTVLVIDGSASMQAREEGGRTRFDLAIERARTIIEARGPADDLMIVEASDRVEVLSPFNRNTLILRDALLQAHPTNRRLDARAACAFAREVARGQPGPHFVFVSDGGAGAVSEAIQGDRAWRQDVVGKAVENVGIVRFSARKNTSLGTDYVIAEVKNFGDTEREFKLEFALNGQTQKVIPKKLAPGAADVERFQAQLSTGGVLRATIDLDDALPIDNVAYAIVQPERLRRILLVAADDAAAAPFKFAFESMREVVDESSQIVTAAEYDALPEGDRTADLTICVGELPAKLSPTSNLVLFATPLPSFLPAEPGNDDPNPEVWDWDHEHLLNRYLNWRDLPLPPSHTFKVKAGSAVVESFEGALVGAFDLPGRRVIYAGFDPTGRLFPFRVAFPIFLRNAIAWFEVSEDVLFDDTYAPGAVIRPVRRVSGSTVTATWVEGGKMVTDSLPVTDGRFQFDRTDRIGTYRFTVGGTDHATAVNLFDPAESSIRPVESPRGDQGSPAASGFFDREIWTILALLALVAWIIEWALYHRRVTE